MSVLVAGHRQLDHTADLALELWADSEVELLEEGARALIGILTEQARVKAPSSRVLCLDALDREDRLIRWLNEVLYLAVSEGFLVLSAEITLEGTGLSARLSGEAGAFEKIRCELKSATYHDLLLQESETGWLARVVIDV